MGADRAARSDNVATLENHVNRFQSNANHDGIFCRH
jgi:hypothetical protein